MGMNLHPVAGRPRWLLLLAAMAGAPVVGLRPPPDQDPFVQQPDRDQAADGLHPSSEGGALWFQRQQQAHALP